MLDAGTRSLHVVGPVYGGFGLGMGLYFASQGAGRLLWPWVANMGRLVVAAGGRGLATRFAGDLSRVFFALPGALCPLDPSHPLSIPRCAPSPDTPSTS